MNISTLNSDVLIFKEPNGREGCNRSNRCYIHTIVRVCLQIIKPIFNGVRIVNGVWLVFFHPQFTCVQSIGTHYWC